MKLGFGSTEKMAIDAGYQQIKTDELLRRTVGKTVVGHYQIGFVFQGYMDADGSMDGENNVGTRDSGQWAVNPADNTLILSWRGGWFESITRIYDVDGALHFFDHDSTNWRMSYFKFVEGRQAIALQNMRPG